MQVRRDFLNAECGMRNWELELWTRIARIHTKNETMNELIYTNAERTHAKAAKAQRGGELVNASGAIACRAFVAARRTGYQESVRAVTKAGTAGAASGPNASSAFATSGPAPELVFW